MSGPGSDHGTDRPVLWINPAVGVAGDMLLAALLDLGAEEAAVRAQLEALDLPGWTLTVAPARRRGLVATAVEVTHPDHDHHRPWSTIDALLAAAPLEPAVRDGSRATFERLARAEAAVHGIDVDAVHFHEVGAVDAVVDVVGTWAALVSLGAGPVRSAPVGLGAGAATMAHGTVPVPAPATLELLTGCPVRPVEGAGETATPTGAALLVTMATSWGPVPAGTLRAVGRGAGRWDPDTHANVVTAVLLDPASERAEGIGDPPGTRVVTATAIETNVDDVTPEVLAHTVEHLLAAGADDAWVVPVVMKKGRAAQTLRVLCRPELAADLRRIVLGATGSLGLRQSTVDKYELPRRTEEVVVEGRTVRVKVGPHGAKPEHDDVVAVAAATGLSLTEVATRALGQLPTPTHTVL